MGLVWVDDGGSAPDQRSFPGPPRLSRRKAIRAGASDRQNHRHLFASPPVLLAMGCFYLWMLMRDNSTESACAETSSVNVRTAVSCAV
jgi:hypothetical protein